MRTLALTAALVALAGAPVMAAPTEAQNNALKHAVNAYYSATFCDDYEADQVLITAMLMVHGIESGDIGAGGRFEPTAKMHMREARSVLDDLPREQACVIGVALYGPNGSNVKGLIKSD